LALLEDVRRITTEAGPKLAKCSTWGPGYFKVVGDESGEVEGHALGFSFYKGKYSLKYVLCALYFPAKEHGAITWEVELLGSKAPKALRVKQPLSMFLVKKKLDASKLARSVERAIKDWKIAF
jgi:hypothetical protein